MDKSLVRFDASQGRTLWRSTNQSGGNPNRSYPILFGSIVPYAILPYPLPLYLLAFQTYPITMRKTSIPYNQLRTVQPGPSQWNGIQSPPAPDEARTWKVAARAPSQPSKLNRKRRGSFPSPGILAGARRGPPQYTDHPRTSTKAKFGAGM